MKNSLRLLSLAGLMTLGVGVVMAQDTSNAASTSSKAPASDSMKPHSSHHSKTTKKSKSHHSGTHTSHSKNTSTATAPK